MSPRAAWRLDALGFDEIYDYVAGKADWGAAGLPLEGHAAGAPTAGRAADTDVPTCTLDDALQVVRARVRATDWRQCVVINEHWIVLGRLGREAIESDDPRTVEEAMTEGPSTIRPDTPLDKLLERLERQQLQTALVTTSEGVLIGVVPRDRHRPS
jgi:Mg/Co/Ni transporter MgtE